MTYMHKQMLGSASSFRGELLVFTSSDLAVLTNSNYVKPVKHDLKSPKMEFNYKKTPKRCIYLG